MRFKAHASAGEIEVRFNGTTVLNLTSLNTLPFATNSGIVHMGYNGSTNTSAHYDDIYICDLSGSANNDFLGDIKVAALFPNGNGNSSQLDGSDGNTTDNYLLVDEAAPDGDTTYVESADIGDKDTYAFENLGNAGSVKGVQIVPRVRKTDAGERSIVSVARLSATEEDGPEKALSTSYVYLPDIREEKPGGGDWTVTDVNNAEFGVKVSA
jgi:hypothetical protein